MRPSRRPARARPGKSRTRPRPRPRMPRWRAGSRPPGRRGDPAASTHAGCLPFSDHLHSIPEPGASRHTAAAAAAVASAATATATATAATAYLRVVLRRRPAGSPPPPPIDRAGSRSVGWVRCCAPRRVGVARRLRGQDGAAAAAASHSTTSSALTIWEVIRKGLSGRALADPSLSGPPDCAVMRRPPPCSRPAGGTQTSPKGVVPPRTDDIDRSAHRGRSLPALAVSSDPWFAPVACPGRVPRPRYSAALSSCCARAPVAARPAARRSGRESGGRGCRDRN